MSTLPPLDPATLERERSRKARAMGSAARHFWQLAAWKKGLLVLALVLAFIGIAGAVTGTVRSKPAEVQTAQVQVEQLHAVGQRSSLTGEQRTQLDQAAAKVDAAKHWFYDQTAPQLWRIGLGFFVAFVIGFAARQFVKTMATLAAIVVVAAGVAIYLGYLDAGSVKANVATGTGWAMDRLDSAKATLLSFVGTSLSGTAGLVIGFTRNRK